MKQETFEQLPKVFTTMIERVIVDGVEYKNIMEWYNSLSTKEGDFTIILNNRKFNNFGFNKNNYKQKSNNTFIKSNEQLRILV